MPSGIARQGTVTVTVSQSVPEWCGVRTVLSTTMENMEYDTRGTENPLHSGRYVRYQLMRNFLLARPLDYGMHSTLSIYLYSLLELDDFLV